MMHPKKHHYIPVFYLKRWASADGKVVEFSRPYGAVVKPYRKHPDATGYELRLYEVNGEHPEQAQWFEELFMGPVDGLAADALSFMTAGFMDDNDWDSTRRSAWSRFILSLLLRTPEDVAQLKSAMAQEWKELAESLEETYLQERDSDDPPTIQEYLASFGREARFTMSIARRLIDHRGLGQVINNFYWSTIDTSAASIELLTSDRPVLMSGTLGERQSYIIMPIGPRFLFAASNDKRALDEVKSQPAIHLVKKSNSLVVAHAVKYVYGQSDSQLRFVQNRMSTIKQSSLLERLAQFREQRKLHAAMNG